MEERKKMKVEEKYVPREMDVFSESMMNEWEHTLATITQGLEGNVTGSNIEGEME